MRRSYLKLILLRDNFSGSAHQARRRCLHDRLQVRLECRENEHLDSVSEFFDERTEARYPFCGADEL